MSFLQQNGLARHADLLWRNGFDDMEALLEMTDPDLKDLGIPACDGVKLRRRLKQLRFAVQRGNEDHPVVAFLHDVGIPQYADRLLQNGFEDLETLLEMQEADMQDLGMLRGHALKLAKRLRELRAGAGPEGGMPPPGRADPRPLPGAAEGHMERVQRLGSSPPSEPARGAVQVSWERLQHLGSSVLGEKLYKNVFLLAPGTVDLFPPEVRYKYREWTLDEVADEHDVRCSPALKKLFGKIVNVVGLSVAGLQEPSRVVPMLVQLGARHIGYGVQEAYWKVMGEAFNLTLQECLGREFTPEVKLAWELVYSFISAIMIEGLRDAIAAQANAADDGKCANAADDTKCADAADDGKSANGDEESGGSSGSLTRLPSSDAYSVNTPQRPPGSSLLAGEGSPQDCGEDVAIES